MKALWEPLSNAINDLINHKIEYIVSTGLVVAPQIITQPEIEQGITISDIGAFAGTIYISGKIIKELLIPLYKQIRKWLK